MCVLTSSLCLYVIYVQDFGVLEGKLDELRRTAADAKDNGEAGEILQKLQNDTRQLLQDTTDIMQTLDGKLL